jgi:hypothetical protein
MGTLQDIVKTHDIKTPTGFKQAIKQAKCLSDGELHFVAGFDPGAQSKEFKEMIALAKAEIGRRQAAEQRNLVWISAGAGFLGVAVGAVLQSLF